eukprot:CAMPEP_0182834612 /NCGR_PEP_ID=MMETSP0006_2-20121128/21016_1 /TAXON_ID=97485 /ORGANISM="Prymnesium parvum, Strain Texoma1" /LENGTH=109 /DNA_ID=CAMNT_0024962887 /DNA_START=556 /DNA_END=886 /DNA_ORIENTATION=+
MTLVDERLKLWGAAGMLVEVGHDNVAQLRHRHDFKWLLNLNAHLLNPHEDIAGDEDPERKHHPIHRPRKQPRQPKQPQDERAHDVARHRRRHRRGEQPLAAAEDEVERA